MKPETFVEQVCRVRLMAEPESDWDFTDNDRAALAAVVRRLQALESSALAGIARVEGKVAPIEYSLRPTSDVAPIPPSRDEALAGIARPQQDNAIPDHICGVCYHPFDACSHCEAVGIALCDYHARVFAGRMRDCRDFCADCESTTPKAHPSPGEGA